MGRKGGDVGEGTRGGTEEVGGEWWREEGRRRERVEGGVREIDMLMKGIIQVFKTIDAFI